MIFEHRTASENSDLMREIFISLDAAIWSFDTNTKQTTVSPGLEKVFGCTEEALHNPDLWQTVTHAEDRHLLPDFIHALETGKSGSLEHRIVRYSGEVRWVQCIATPVTNDIGQVTRINGVIHDITSNKEAKDALDKTKQEALQRSEQRYRSLFEQHSDMIVELDVQGRIKAMNPAANKVFGRGHSAGGHPVWPKLLGEDGQTRATEYFELAKRGEAQHYEISSSHCGVINDWDVTHVPIYVNGQISGIFAFVTDVTEKNKIEKALADSEAMYRLIAENTKDLLAILDLTGHFLYVSPSCEKVLGRDNRSLIGNLSMDYIHTEDRDDASRGMSEALLTGTTQQAQIRLVHADGRPICIGSIGTPVFGQDGQVESFVLVGRDITEEVRVQTMLKESQARYKRLIELSPQPMITHRDGIMIYINAAGLELLAANQASDVIGKSVFDFVHPDYQGTAEHRVAASKINKYSGKLDYRLFRIDRQIIEVEVTGIYDDETQTNLLVLSDVTERRKMERALLDSEERYRRMVEMSPSSIAVYKDYCLNYLNPAGQQLIGAKKPADYEGVNPLDLVHPDDRELAAKRIEHTYRVGYCPPAEYRLVRLDGELVHVSVASIYDALSGSAQLVFTDVSLTKQAETALLESEEMNRRLVELSPEAIILHSEYRYIYANPAALTLLGADGDLTGLPLFEQVHPDDQARTASRLRQAYLEGITSSLVEQKVVRFDGTVVDVEVICSPISHKGKNAAISLIREITQRKKADEQLVRVVQELIDTKNRYHRLHTSLDRFSSDLFGVMKLQELERRLVQEVRDVLDAGKVSIIEIESHDHFFIKAGTHVPNDLPADLFEWNHKQPVCEIIDRADGYLVKLGEIRGKIYLLCIGEKPASLQLEPKRVWLETICRYVSVLYDNFRVIEDLTKELGQITREEQAPSWLLRILFRISEHERKRLSQDLHDDALQEQIIWYRKLDELFSDRSLPDTVRDPLKQIKEGLLNVIYQIRITCNELRPPMLKQEGIVSSLEALFEFTQIRANYAIRFDASDFHTTLNEDQIIGLYRIIQELLANATKHSNATMVEIRLISRAGWIELKYKDNGIGMDLNKSGDTFKSMGVYGIRERVRSLNGNIELQSAPNKGVAVFILLPTESCSNERAREYI